MSLLTDIQTVLVNAGVVGGVTGWTLFLGYLPPDPDQAVAVTETGGEPADQTEGTRVDEITFQIQVRAAAYRYEDARTKLDGVFAALNDSALPNSTFVYVSSGPTPLGYDANYRPKLSLNFKTLRVRV